MSDQDQRPTKNRKTQGQPFLQEVQSGDDDDVSSTTSSSSSEVLLPLRSQTQRLGPLGVHGRDRISSSDEGDGEDAGEEDDMTTSSGSEDPVESSSDDASNDEDEVEQDEASQKLSRTTGCAKLLQPSNIRSRLQDFLPRLEQANADLKLGGNMQDRMVDQASDEDEQYIEMDLSLGVLTEQDNQESGVKMPLSRGEDGQASDDEEMELELSTSKAARKSTKCKIEELG